jgi:membrane protein required for colicin V production
VTLDLVVLGLVLLAALAGALGGALRQVLKLAALVAAWAAARWLAPRLTQELHDPSTSARVAVIAGTFLVAWLVAALLATGIRRAVQGEEQRPGWIDRTLGALLGAAKGALVAWVALALLALLGGRFTVGSFRVESRGSQAAALAARHDLLAAASPGAARSARRLVQLWSDPAARERLLRDPAWKKLLERSGLKAALDRGPGAAGEPSEAAGERARKRTEELLADPELKALLEKLSLEP